MHCFSGDVPIARRCLDLGLTISLAGPVTYPNARALPEVARFVPADRLVVETDCPFLPPAGAPRPSQRAGLPGAHGGPRRRAARRAAGRAGAAHERQRPTPVPGGVSGMDWRDLGFYARARLEQRPRALEQPHAPALAAPAPLEDVLHGARTPLALSAAARGAQQRGPRGGGGPVAAGARRAVRARPLRHVRGRAARTSGSTWAAATASLVLIAHHDAVPGSPGANDNAASVAILLSLLERWAVREPSRARAPAVPGLRGARLPRQPGVGAGRTA